MEAAIITGAATITVAVIGLISAIIANRKKTEEIVKAVVKEEVTKGNAETNKQIAEVQATLDSHIKESEVDKAKAQRDRILRFYDEICAKIDHSEPVYLGILDDIDEYEAYCSAHPDFKNSRGKMAMTHIRDTYDMLKSTGQFEPKE